MTGKTGKEYPAGHSVDTEWFAVDKEGIIMRMWSDDDGYLPSFGDHAFAYNSEVPHLEDLAVHEHDDIYSLIQPSDYRLRLSKFMEHNSVSIEHWKGDMDYLSLSLLILAPGVQFEDLSIYKEKKYSGPVLKLTEEGDVVWIPNWMHMDGSTEEDIREKRLQLIQPVFEEATDISYLLANYSGECDGSYEGGTFEDPSLVLKASVVPAGLKLDVSAQEGGKFRLLDKCYGYYPYSDWNESDVLLEHAILVCDEKKVAKLLLTSEAFRSYPKTFLELAEENYLKCKFFCEHWKNDEDFPIHGYTWYPDDAVRFSGDILELIKRRIEELQNEDK